MKCRPAFPLPLQFRRFGEAAGPGNWGERSLNSARDRHTLQTETRRAPKRSALSLFLLLVFRPQPLRPGFFARAVSRESPNSSARLPLPSFRSRERRLLRRTKRSSSSDRSPLCLFDILPVYTHPRLVAAAAAVITFVSSVSSPLRLATLLCFAGFDFCVCVLCVYIVPPPKGSFSEMINLSLSSPSRERVAVRFLFMCVRIACLGFPARVASRPSPPSRRGRFEGWKEK